MLDSKWRADDGSSIAVLSGVTILDYLFESGPLAGAVGTSAQDTFLQTYTPVSHWEGRAG